MTILPEPRSAGAPARRVARLARLSLARLSILGACALTLHTVPSTAAAASGQSEAVARYRQERAACLDGTSHQDRATCLKEAGAALQEARRGRLDDGDAAYEQNRLRRCERVAPADRDDCLRRMRGDGSVSGSVERGGNFRELRTIQEAPAR